MSTLKHPLYPVDYYNDFRQFLLGIREKFSSRPAVTWYERKGEECNRRYEELCGDSLAFGESLCAAGLQGSHVAIAGENSYEWLTAFYGVTASGSVAVCIDVEQSLEVIRRMIFLADSRILLASPTIATLLAPLLDEPESPLEQMLVLSSGEEDGLFMSIREFSETGRQRLAQGRAAMFDTPIEKNQPAAIFYTSGTTSMAKPVMLSHYGLITNASDSISMVTIPEKIFTALPFYHTYALTCSVNNIFIKGMHLCINGDLKRMARDLVKFDPGMTMAVPLMVETIHQKLLAEAEKAGKKELVNRLLKLNTWLHKLGIRRPMPPLKKAKEAGLGHLSEIICGGAHLSKTISQNLLAFGIHVLEGYGITECSPLISVNRKASYRFSTAGLLLPGVRVQIRDEEIWIKGPSVMLGYYKDPESTRQVMKDGWFNTGDIGCLDKEGFLHITGRKKNLIVLKNGKKIAPEEIESYLKDIPLIKEVVAYGAISGDSTDDVRLAVIIYPDEKAAEGLAPYEVLEQLQQEINKINQKLPSYKQIQMVNLRNEEFEKTAAKKIKR
ncbi:MAG: AMP-binding protein [Peptococcaceae bacterium]|nr:AMP-binding protein [Peptococcaceae bacterium]